MNELEELKQENQILKDQVQSLIEENGRYKILLLAIKNRYRLNDEEFEGVSIGDNLKPLDFTNFLDLDIDVLSLSNRTENALKRGGLTTIKNVIDFDNRKEAVFSTIRGLGVLSYKELNTAMRSIGYVLKSNF